MGRNSGGVIGSASGSVSVYKKNLADAYSAGYQRRKAELEEYMANVRTMAESKNAFLPKSYDLSMLRYVRDRVADGKSPFTVDHYVHGKDHVYVALAKKGYSSNFDAIARTMIREKAKVLGKMFSPSKTAIDFANADIQNIGMMKAEKEMAVKINRIMSKYKL